MKNVALAFCISVVLVLCGCSKSPSGPWSGTYVNVLGVSDSFSTVSVIYTGNNTVNVICKLYEFGYSYTAFTLQNVALADSTATFNQKQHIVEATDLGPFLIQGDMSLSGSQITFSAVATNLTTHNASDTKNFQFTGTRSQ